MIFYKVSSHLTGTIPITTVTNGCHVVSRDIQADEGALPPSDKVFLLRSVMVLRGFVKRHQPFGAGN